MNGCVRREIEENRWILGGKSRVPVAVSIVSSFAPPPEGSELVLFASGKNYVAQYDSQKLLSAAVRYARKYGVYLLPDRFIADDYLCLCLIAPDGSPVLGQQATHLNLDYRGVFRQASEVETADTPFGRVALAVDVDINVPQYAREAARKGAKLLLSSQFIQLFDFYHERVNYGPVSAARCNGLHVAAVVSAGGVIVAPDGRLLAGYSEDLPVLSMVEPEESCPDLQDLETGRRLLSAHFGPVLGRQSGGQHHE